MVLQVPGVVTAVIKVSGYLALFSSTGHMLLCIDLFCVPFLETKIWFIFVLKFFLCQSDRYGHDALLLLF